ncbi:MAG TPA: hypothetical protein VE890_02185 [Thermoguttaceae bacterium]|nr:hypothetical protein [Thermoguttaceae bacterium]
MSEFVRCKPCGYIARKGTLRRVCPACGAALSAFEPYEDRVSASRRLVLSLDLHPILVHAPQTFATFLPGLAAVAMLFPAFYPAELRAVVCFQAFILPVSVVGAILSGLIDGKLKFKRLGVPLVVRKVLVGTGLLVVSTVNAAIVFVDGFQDGTRLVVLLLGVASLVCAVLLGTTGKKLIIPILPGR